MSSISSSNSAGSLPLFPAQMTAIIQYGEAIAFQLQLHAHGMSEDHEFLDDRYVKLFLEVIQEDKVEGGFVPTRPISKEDTVGILANFSAADIKELCTIHPQVLEKQLSFYPFLL